MKNKDNTLQQIFLLSNWLRVILGLNFEIQKNNLDDVS